MFSEQSMRYSFFRIDEIDDPIGIFSLTGCKDNDFVELRHFKEESIESETLGCIDPCAFSIQGNFRLEIGCFGSGKCCMYECFIEIKD